MNSLGFPSHIRQDIADNKPYVKFSIPIDPANVIEADVRQVILFMPDDVGVVDGSNYEGVELGLSNAIKALKNKTSQISNADLAVASIKVLDLISTPLSDLAPAKALGISNRVAFNPQSAMQFKGVNAREYSFTYILVASNEAESVIMMQIENFFRKYLYPQAVGTWSVKYPPIFRVDFEIAGRRNEFYPMYYDSFLNGVTTVMNPNGRAFFANGAPTSVSITLAFSESKKLTREVLYSGSGLKYNTTESGMNPTLPAGDLSGVSRDGVDAIKTYADTGE